MLLYFDANVSKDLVELLQRRAADSEQPITATHTEHAKLRRRPRKPNRAADVSLPQRQGLPVQSGARVGPVSPQGPSRATAVLLGAHQHFAVELLLLFFKGVFHLCPLQSSIPAKQDQGGIR